MKIVYAGLQSDRYDTARGSSFEHNNFFLSLKNFPRTKVFYFPYERILVGGRKKFNQELLKIIEGEAPDLFFAFMYTDELDFRTLDEIKKKTTSLAWFSDDHWRLYNYSRFYAPHFTWAITTYSRAPAIYARYNIKNIIRSQWGCDSAIYKPAKAKQHQLKTDITFIGQRNPARKKIINHLARAGLKVECFGAGWPKGRISQEKMIEVFQISKINLNFNNPPSPFSPHRLGRIFLRRSRNLIVPDIHFISNLKSWRRMGIPQIKARPFEIAGSGGFCLSGWADDIQNYFIPDKEMVFYHNLEELAQKIKFYLYDNESRENIRRAGYLRTAQEHSYEQRFHQIFKKIF